MKLSDMPNVVICGKCDGPLVLGEEEVDQFTRCVFFCKPCNREEHECVCPVEDNFREYLNQYGGKWRNYGVKVRFLTGYALPIKKKELFFDCLCFEDKFRLRSRFGYYYFEKYLISGDTALEFLLYGEN